MRENRNLVVPVNILTPFAQATGPHDTLPCVLIASFCNNACLIIAAMVKQL